MSFAPAWAIWGALLVSVFVVACLIHAGALAFLSRVVRQRQPYLSRILIATKNPTRVALLLIAGPRRWSWLDKQNNPAASL